MTGALLLFLVPVNWRRGEFAMTWHRAERLPWSVLILFGGGLSLAGAFQQTGLATWLGAAIGDLGAWPVILVALAITTMIVFLTEVTSNTAITATFLPVIAALAIGIGDDPLLLALQAVLGASCAFMMPVGTRPNAIVYASGQVTIPQVAHAGIVLNFLLIALITVVAFGIATRVF